MTSDDCDYGVDHVGPWCLIIQITEGTTLDHYVWRLWLRSGPLETIASNEYDYGVDNLGPWHLMTVIPEWTTLHHDVWWLRLRSGPSWTMTYDDCDYGVDHLEPWRLMIVMTEGEHIGPWRLLSVITLWTTLDHDVWWLWWQRGNTLDHDDLLEPLQSAYRKYHSTDTALIKIQSDILQALDSGRVAALVLLDLSAAFDTLDHSILIERLQKSFGISGDALTWVISYLRRRNQQVLIGDTASAEVVIEYGVPQGSVLGPKLYSLYTKPLADIIRHHQLDMHFYADDTQLYVSFENNAPEQQSTAVTRLNTCIGDIRNWLADL